MSSSASRARPRGRGSRLRTGAAGDEGRGRERKVRFAVDEDEGGKDAANSANNRGATTSDSKAATTMDSRRRSQNPNTRKAIAGTRAVNGAARRSGPIATNGSLRGGKTAINGHLSSTKLAGQAKGLGGSSVQGDYQERYQKLKHAREKERVDAIKNGFLADPDKPRTLAEAITPRGTCQDMCPEFERVQRVVQNDHWPAEMNPDTLANGSTWKATPDESRMVKKFRRAAAGIDEQLPSDLRPPLVLQKTLDYLIDDLIGQADDLATVHHFVWDRTRAIRNDFSIQQISKVDELRIAIQCYERIARFHILSLHELARAEKPYPEYDAQQEREQLDKTLLSLMQYYDDSRGRLQYPNEAEFRAYGIIFQIQDPKSDLEDRVQSWPKEIIRNQRVKRALSLYAAACTTDDLQGPLQPRINHPIAQANWRRFWVLLESNQISFLMACVAEIYFNIMRRVALKSIWTSYRASATTRTEDWTLSELLEPLAFDDEKQVEDYCKSFGFSVLGRSDGQQFVNLSSVNPGELADPSSTHVSSQIVENKRRGRTLPAVINGMSVKAAEEAGLVQEDTQSNDDDESLFISDSPDEKVKNNAGSSAGKLDERKKAAFLHAQGTTKDRDVSKQELNKILNQDVDGRRNSFTNTPFEWNATAAPFQAAQTQNNPPITNVSTPLDPSAADPSKERIQQSGFNFASFSNKNGFGKSSSLAVENAETQASAFQTSSGPASLANNTDSSTPSLATITNSSGTSFTGTPFKSQTSSSPAPPFADTQPSASLKGSSPFSFPQTPTLNSNKLSSNPFTQNSSTTIKSSTLAGTESLSPNAIQPPFVPSQNSFNNSVQSITAQPASAKGIGSTEMGNSLFKLGSQQAPNHPPDTTSSSMRRGSSQALTSPQNQPPGPTSQNSLPTPDSQEIAKAQAKAQADDAAAELAKTQAYTQMMAQRKNALLDQLTQLLIMEPHGFIDQFVEFTAAPIVAAAFKKVQSEKAIKEADTFRINKIMTRYGIRWRTLYWKHRRERQGTERRRRMAKEAKARAQRYEESIGAQLDNFRQSRSGAGVASNNTVRDELRTDIESTDQSTFVPAPINHIKHGGDRSSNAMPQEDLSAIRHRRSQSAYASRSDMTNSLRSSHNRPTRDTTRTSYFKLKAMGLNPGLKPLNMPASPDRKRSRDDDADVQVGPRKRSQTLPSENVAEQKSATAASVSLGSSDNGAMNTSVAAHDEDEELFAAVRVAQQAMRDSISFYKGEVTKDSLRRSQSSDTHEQTPSSSEAAKFRQQVAQFNSPQAPISTKPDHTNFRTREPPPKYRNRVSKFLPRERYADNLMQKRAQSGSMGSRLFRHSVSSTDSNGALSEGRRSFTGKLFGRSTARMSNRSLLGESRRFSPQPEPRTDGGASGTAVSNSRTQASLDYFLSTNDEPFPLESEDNRNPPQTERIVDDSQEYMQVKQEYADNDFTGIPSGILMGEIEYLADSNGTQISSGHSEENQHGANLFENEDEETFTQPTQSQIQYQDDNDSSKDDQEEQSTMTNGYNADHDAQYFSSPSDSGANTVEDEDEYEEDTYNQGGYRQRDEAALGREDDEDLQDGHGEEDEDEDEDVDEEEDDDEDEDEDDEDDNHSSSAFASGGEGRWGGKSGTSVEDAIEL